MFGIKVDRTNRLWRPLGPKAKGVLLAISLIMIATTAAAGWYSWQGAYTGTVSTAQGVTIEWVNAGNCDLGGTPGTVNSYQENLDGATFSLAGIKPTSVLTCYRTVRNVGAVPLTLSVVPSVPWVTVDVVDLSVPVGPGSEKEIRQTIHFLETMPTGAVNLPVSIALTLAQ